jgi:hypothetical protein
MARPILLTRVKPSIGKLHDGGLRAPIVLLDEEGADEESSPVESVCAVDGYNLEEDVQSLGRGDVSSILQL